MRGVFLWGLLVTALATPSPAQVPRVAVYADAVGQACNILDTGPAPFSVYVFVTDVDPASPGITAVQFAAPKPACMQGVDWLSDTPVFPVTLGNSQVGVSIGFGSCLNTPVHVLTINYYGQGLSDACCLYQVVPDPVAVEGEILLTDCSFETLIGATFDHRVNGNGTCPCSNRPTVPSEPSPADGATNQPTDLTLSWTSTDPQGQPLTFDVYLGLSPEPPLIAAYHPGASYPVSLGVDTTYFWRIVARDGENLEQTGPLWRFETLALKPFSPENPTPADGAVNQPLSLTLEWDCSDPQGDPLTYDVYFGTSSDPPFITLDHPTDSYHFEGPLEPGVWYFWRIVARDTGGHVRSGPVWAFQTFDDRPYRPSNPVPASGAIGQPASLTLSWHCSDPQGDPLVYDIYFGASLTPPLVAVGQPDTSYSTGPLLALTRYYWYVVARDDKGSESTGPMWNFQTGSAAPNPPSNPVPLDNAGNQPLNVVLSWQCSDPRGEPLSYDIYFGGPLLPYKQIARNRTLTWYEVGPLPGPGQYYWHIVARNTSGYSTSSPTWRFGTSSQYPGPPRDPSPGDSSHAEPYDVTLNWECTDPQGDPVVFDVYFGMGPFPQLRATNVSIPSYRVGALAPESAYSWRIVARDSWNHETKGVVWSFTTGSAAAGLPWNPSPASGATGQPPNVTLSWSCSGCEDRTYDLYFGDAVAPPLVATGLTSAFYDAAPFQLEPAKEYWWRVVSVDAGGGNDVSGPTWKFITMGEGPSRLEVSSVYDYCSLDPLDTVTVRVSMVNSAGSIDAGGFDLTYDPGVLTFLSGARGTLTEDWDQFAFYDQGSSVRVGGYHTQPIPAGTSGPLAELKFLSGACGQTEPVSVDLCPENVEDDLEALIPICGTYVSLTEPYSGDGDVDGNGEITPGDASCAFVGYLEAPDSPSGDCGSPGWDIRADVDCDAEVTPADASCIYAHWLDGSCEFCGAPARTISTSSEMREVIVFLSLLEGETNEIRIAVGASGISGMRSFGFEMTYPSWLEFAGIEKTKASDGFVEIGAREAGNGRIRAGGYSHEPFADGGGGFVVVRFLQRGESAGGTVTADRFVDALEGAKPAEYAFEDGQNGSPTVSAYRLHQNHPNPFNPSTTIRFEIPNGDGSVRVALAIYDVEGRKVRELVSGNRPGGTHYAEWDGKDETGRPVSSGVYFCVLRAGAETLTRKMALLR
jgi:hypothetical protein